jgi:hypothetical protein
LGLEEFGHALRLGPISTRIKLLLDVRCGPLYCRHIASSNRLERSVVHSHRTQSASDYAQLKTGRTPRLSPRRPALTTRNL